ncbi:adenylosuccinate lyase [Lapidilactobacillus dextrinicus DSM 20335]|uniref:Adenylosuccinate lyase n=1 Tax=Lapidilactobacillus dextrinicus DSM 20335 TaxID=1423738 RepID=A0A0R2BSW7_9LACO|nr:adenylosuccinate lyase [Lapidilactobacillus dextrinicus DSM 20335]
MLERYSRPEMQQIWSLQNQYQSWLEVEVLACQAWSKVGEVPEADALKITENASFTTERVQELEKVTKHDVVAFTRAVSESLGAERKWVHFGLTSTDVVDYSSGLSFKASRRRFTGRFKRVISNY